MIHLRGQPIERIIAWSPGGVALQPLVLSSSQQLIDRQADHLPLQIPQCRFDSCQDNGS